MDVRSKVDAQSNAGINSASYLAYAKLLRKLGVFHPATQHPEDYVKYIVFNASTM